jgi:hypothetical protein
VPTARRAERAELGIGVLDTMTRVILVAAAWVSWRLEPVRLILDRLRVSFDRGMPSVARRFWFMGYELMPARGRALRLIGAQLGFRPTDIETPGAFRRRVAEAVRPLPR